MRLFIIMSHATPVEGASTMSPLPMTPSTNGGFLSQSQDLTASQPVPAPSGKGGKKDNALKIKLADHCEKKGGGNTLGETAMGREDAVWADTKMV